MLLTEGMSDSKNVVIKNGMGQVVSKVKSFDTETKEAELYATVLVSRPNKERLKQTNIRSMSRSFTPIFVHTGPTDTYFLQGQESERSVVTFKCHLIGFKAYNKKTGEEIK